MRRHTDFAITHTHLHQLTLFLHSPSLLLLLPLSLSLSLYLSFTCRIEDGWEARNITIQSNKFHELGVSIESYMGRCASERWEVRGKWSNWKTNLLGFSFTHFIQRKFILTKSRVNTIMIIITILLTEYSLSVYSIDSQMVSPFMDSNSLHEIFFRIIHCVSILTGRSNCQFNSVVRNI